MSGQQCQQVSHSAASGLPGPLLGSFREERRFTSGPASAPPHCHPPALADLSSFLGVGGGAVWEQRLRGDNDAISIFFFPCLAQVSILSLLCLCILLLFMYPGAAKYLSAAAGV